MKVLMTQIDPLDQNQHWIIVTLVLVLVPVKVELLMKFPQK